MIQLKGSISNRYSTFQHVLIHDILATEPDRVKSKSKRWKHYSTSDIVVRTAEILSYAGYLSFIDLTFARVESTQSWSCIGADHTGPPMLNFFPQSLHSWGTTGPKPGRYLTLLFFITKKEEEQYMSVAQNWTSNSFSEITTPASDTKKVFKRIPLWLFFQDFAGERNRNQHIGTHMPI